MNAGKTQQRLIGLVLLILGGGLTAWSWWAAQSGSTYYPAVVTVSSGLAVYALAPLLFPIDKDQVPEYGTDRMRLGLLPLAWKALFVAAALVSLGNALAVSRWSQVG